MIGAVNLAEVVTKLRERGLSLGEAEEAPGRPNLHVHPYSPARAHATGHLRPATRAQGLSFGDRAVLALGAMGLTADQAWASMEVDVVVELIR